MPTCIKCGKIMKRGYKKIKTVKRFPNEDGTCWSNWGKAWACSDRFCNVDLDLKNGYENEDGVWVVVGAWSASVGGYSA